MSGRSWIVVVILIALGVPVAMAPRFWRETAVVTKGPLADRVVLRAVVVAAEGAAEVAAEGGGGRGRVRKVFVREGERVAKGQALAEIEGDGGSGTGTGTRTVTSDAIGTVVAPIAGVVLVRRIDVGDSVQVASQGGTLALFEIADADNTEVRVEIEERDFARLKVGLEAMLTTPGGGTNIGLGTIARVGARIERRTIGVDDVRVRADGSVRAAWIAWRGPAPKVALGQELEARVSFAPKPTATRVPRSAVVVREGRTIVDTPWLLWSRELSVRVRTADDALVEVEGVSPGTRAFLN